MALSDLDSSSPWSSKPYLSLINIVPSPKPLLDFTSSACN